MEHSTGLLGDIRHDVEELDKAVPTMDSEMYRGLGDCDVGNTRLGGLM